MSREPKGLRPVSTPGVECTARAQVLEFAEQVGIRWPLGKLVGVLANGS